MGWEGRRRGREGLGGVAGVASVAAVCLVVGRLESEQIMIDVHCPGYASQVSVLCVCVVAAAENSFLVH